MPAARHLCSALVAGVCLSGCASMTTAEKAYLGVVAADIGSTAIALQRGLEEQNPLLRGDSDGETIARALVVNAAIYWMLHEWIDKHSAVMQRKYWRLMVGLRAPVVGWNVYQIAEAD